MGLPDPAEHPRRRRCVLPRPAQSARTRRPRQMPGRAVQTRRTHNGPGGRPHEHAVLHRSGAAPPAAVWPAVRRRPRFSPPAWPQLSRRPAAGGRGEQGVRTPAWCRRRGSAPRGSALRLRLLPAVRARPWGVQCVGVWVEGRLSVRQAVSGVSVRARPWGVQCVGVWVEVRLPACQGLARAVDTGGPDRPLAAAGMPGGQARVGPAARHTRPRPPTPPKEPSSRYILPWCGPARLGVAVRAKWGKHRVESALTCHGHRSGRRGQRLHRERGGR